jgi:uncharacterized protein
MKRLMGLVLCALLFSGVVSAQTFDRRAMLENLVNNIIVPNHQAFWMSTMNLEQGIVAFSLAPNEETLVQIQDLWRASAIAYQPVQLLGFRDVMTIHSRIYKATKPETIERTIAGDSVLDVEFVQSIGSNTIGLPALEYLLFDAQGDNTLVLNALTEDQRRMEYLVAVAQALRMSADDLQVYWQDNAEAFIAADQDGGDLQGSINMLVNEILPNLEVLITDRMGSAMGILTGEPNPEDTEAHLSNNGLSMQAQTVEAICELMSGGDGVGFDDYLVFIEQTSLAETLTTQCETIRVGFDELIAQAIPLEQLVTDSEDLRVLLDEIRELSRYLEVDMTNQLGIAITFSDNDGD